MAWIGGLRVLANQQEINPFGICLFITEARWPKPGLFRQAGICPLQVAPSPDTNHRELIGNSTRMVQRRRRNVPSQGY